MRIDKTHGSAEPVPSDTMPALESGVRTEQAGTTHEPSVTASLLDCRKQYAELETAREHELITYNKRYYELAATVFRWAIALSDQNAWSEFVASPEWRDRKRPRQRDHAKALRLSVVRVFETTSWVK